MEKIYRVQMNSNGMPNFSTAVEIDTDISEYSDKLWKNAYERGKADRPQAEWVKRTKERLFATVNFAYCENCGEPIMHEFTRPLWNYCPNCGAHMKGADDETIRTEDI